MMHQRALAGTQQVLRGAWDTDASILGEPTAG